MAVGIGIELASSAVRVAILEQSGNELKLLAARELPCETSNPEALTRTITQLRQTLRISQSVVLGLPTTSAILTTITPLVANPLRANLAVQFELQQQLPFEVAETAWHYRWLPMSNGHTLEGSARLNARSPRQPLPSVSAKPNAVSGSPQTAAVVAAMKRARLEERLACCRRAGLRVRAVAINAVATLNAWMLQRGETLPEDRVLLNLIDDRTAEWIACGAASLRVMPVASPSPEAFWSELSASWNAVQFQGESLPKTVGLIGFSAVPAQLHSHLRIGSEVRIEQFELKRAVAAAVVQLEAPERAVAALGLAAQSLGLVRLPLNLLSSDQRQVQSQHVQRMTAVVSGLCVLATIGVGLSGMVEARHRRLAVLQSLERQERLFQTLRPEIRSLLQRQRRIERRSLQLANTVREAPVLTEVLAQIAQALPDGVWLTKVEGSRGAGVEVLLEGRAATFQDVSQFLNQLKVLGGMSTVKLLSNTVATDPASGKELIAFAVQAQRQMAPPSSPSSKQPDGGGTPSSSGKNPDEGRAKGQETPKTKRASRTTKVRSQP